MEVAVLNPYDLLKAKAATQGETHTWSDGRTYKKIGKRWVQVATSKGTSAKKTVKHVEANVQRKSREHFNYAMASNLGGTVDDVLQGMGIDSYEALVKKIKTGSTDAAHKIYKKIVDTIRAGEGTKEDQQSVLHMIGTSLVALRNQYSVQPKAAMTIKVASKKGTGYYKYKETEGLPTLKASAISKAKKKMGGWSVTGKLESKHVQAMIKNKAAKLTFGKINPKKKWIMPRKSEGIDLKYKGDSLLIRVKQIRKVEERTRATAKAEIKIPYEFAKAFLQSHVKSKKVRNKFIFRMEHSAGYRDFLQRAAA